MINLKQCKNLETTAPLTIRELEKYYIKNQKTDFKYGLEYERLSIDAESGLCADYDRIKEVIINFVKIKNWELIFDGDTVIGGDIRNNFTADGTIIGAKSVLNGGKTTISLEPGGQFELSLEPKKTIKEIEIEAGEILGLLDKIASIYNVKFLAKGIQPKSTYQNIEILDKKRYIIMANYLPKIAKFAPIMMRETAGIQLNVDYSSPNDAFCKLKLLNLIMPFMTGLYANSNVRNNKKTNYKSFRALAWLYTGRNRCNVFYKDIFKNFKKENITYKDYIEAILDVPMIFIERNGAKLPLNGKITFGQFMEKGLGECHATLDDYLLHASLCFPDIRLKNCIEIRNHDSNDFDLMLSICAFYKGLLSGDLDEYLKLFKNMTFEDIEKYAFLSAKSGLNYEIEIGKKKISAKDFLKQFFDIAKDNLEDAEKGYLSPAIQLF